jgi:hypothetical protein
MRTSHCADGGAQGDAKDIQQYDGIVSDIARHSRARHVRVRLGRGCAAARVERQKDTGPMPW